MPGTVADGTPWMVSIELEIDVACLNHIMGFIALFELFESNWGHLDAKHARL